MHPGFDIINRVWQHAPHHRSLYHVLADHDRTTDSWTDHFLKPGYGAKNGALPSVTGSDLYWAPLGFQHPERRNKTAADFAVLFADIDDGRIVKFHGDLPSFLWQTSPGMYQAVWLLDEPLPTYESWASLNQRLTYFLEADKGGWMGSKVLRIPGSVNFKRSTEGVLITGKIINQSGWVFETAKLDDLLPKVHKRGPMDPTEVPASWTRAEHYARSKELPLSLRALLFQKTVGDRSLHIVRTANEFIRQGVSMEDTYRFIEQRPWNKFDWRPATLWAEVQTAAVSAEY